MANAIPKKQVALTCALFLGYILLLAYFNFIDVYHHQFFATGFTVLLYNLMRLFFILYLMWLFYAAGDIALSMDCFAAKNAARNDDLVQKILLSFFAGIGIWHIILLLLGFAGVYSRSLMAILTLSLFAVSLPKLNRWINFISTPQTSFLHNSSSRARKASGAIHKSNDDFAQKTINATRTRIYWPGILILLIPLLLFLSTKGLYPAGGHDYFNHYFAYYLKVTESGSILPNEVWYPFYYNKGDGLFFLGMLLTDPLAPQLATTAFIFAGAAIIFSILKESSNEWRLLPWLGAALYLLFLIYTPGPIANMHEGGWADLEKPHEPASVLMLAMIWITIGLAKTKDPKRWGITLILTMSALILINPFVFIYASAYLSLAAFGFYIYRKKSAAIWSVAGAATAIGWFFLLAVINYYMTGVPDEQKLLVYLPIINFEKVKHWGVIVEILKLHWDRARMLSNQIPFFSKQFLQASLSYIRLDVWGPLFILATVLLGLRYSQNWHKSMHQSLDKIAIAACSLFLILVLLLSVFIGRDQSTSYYRFTIFSYAPMLCFCLLLIAAGLRQTKLTTLIFLVGFVATWMMLKPYTNFEGKKIQSVIKNGLRFTTGQFSIADGYRHQQGWPGRMPWGAIYPAAETIWSQLPLKTRIWSMHVHSYCMLPDCRMESYPSYRFSTHEDIVYYASPQTAKMILQKEGLNYFFFSNALPLNVTDALPLSPLFSPANIGSYLGIAWTNGQDTLLTWKEQARYPLDSAWIDKYRLAIDHSSLTNFPYQRIQTALNTLANKSHLKKTDMPW